MPRHDHYPAPGREPVAGQLLRRIPLPYGMNAVPQLYHSIMQGIRHRETRDVHGNASSPYYPPTTTTGGDDNYFPGAEPTRGYDANSPHPAPYTDPSPIPFNEGSGPHSDPYGLDPFNESDPARDYGPQNQDWEQSIYGPYEYAPNFYDGPDSQPPDQGNTDYGSQDYNWNPSDTGPYADLPAYDPTSPFYDPLAQPAPNPSGISDAGGPTGRDYYPQEQQPDEQQQLPANPFINPTLLAQLALIAGNYPSASQPMVFDYAAGHMVPLNQNAPMSGNDYGGNAYGGGDINHTADRLTVM